MVSHLSDWYHSTRWFGCTLFSYRNCQTPVSPFLSGLVQSAVAINLHFQPIADNLLSSPGSSLFVAPQDHIGHGVWPWLFSVMLLSSGGMIALRPPEQGLGHAGEWCARHVPSVVPSLSPAGQPSTSAHLKSFIHLAKATTFNWINLLGLFSVRKLVFFNNAVPHHSGPLQKPLFSVIVIYSGFNQLNEQSKWLGWHPVNVLKSTVRILELNKVRITTFGRIFANLKLLSSI